MTHRQPSHSLKQPSPDETPSSLPPLPINPQLWQSVAKAMHLSDQLARVVELILRGLNNKDIAQAMRVEECTLDTYMDRIGTRIGARGRNGILRHVLKLSHELRDQAQLSTPSMT